MRIQKLPRWKPVMCTTTVKVSHVGKEIVISRKRRSFGCILSSYFHDISWLYLNGNNVLHSYTFWYMWWCIITRKNIEELYILRFVCSDPIIWFFLLFSAFTSDINRPWLREYPVRFGMAMVDLYSDLIRTSQGMAPYPDPVPAAFDSFMAMRKTDSGLGFSGLGDVYRYLRGGRHLKLPRDWRPFVPKEAPLETETQNSWGFHLKSNDCGFVSKNMILNS